MITKSLFIQIAMIALSIGIIITFVNPKFSEIGDLQDDIAVYQAEQQKVAGVNAQLSSLINVLDGVAPDDQKRLLRYMPDEVDTISVVRDLKIISDEADVVYISAASTGIGVPASEREEVGRAVFVAPRVYSFSLSVEGTYEQVKNLFVLLEQNNYPIEVKNMSVQKKTGGFLSVDIDLSVYAHESNVANQEIVF